MWAEYAGVRIRRFCVRLISTSRPRTAVGVCNRYAAADGTVPGRYAADWIASTHTTASADLASSLVAARSPRRKSAMAPSRRACSQACASPRRRRSAPPAGLGAGGALQAIASTAAG